MNKNENSNIIMSDILKSLNLDASLLVSSNGLKKENIYKKDVFADCITDRDKKTTRRKIRNLLDSYVKTILQCKDAIKLQKLCADFNKFYFAIYAINDYSLQSIASNNTDETKKENLQKFLQIVQKNTANKPTAKTTKKKVTAKKENNVIEENNEEKKQ